VALVVFIVAMRRRTTLEDDSLVAGAFLCYVAWAIMGWRWLVPPIVVFVGYKWLSPRTADNSRRMHDVPALLSVWAAAVAWLALAHATAATALLLPYTLVFAAHLAMFGVSRLAYQFPERPVAVLFWRAVAASWVIVMVPFVLTAGATATNLAGAGCAIAAIALGTATFLRLQTDIRNAPQTLQRWVHQAGAAGVASLAGWLLFVGVSRSFL
jgi:phytol kinase